MWGRWVVLVVAILLLIGLVFLYDHSISFGSLNFSSFI